MFGLNVIFKLIKIFHSKEEPHHIALGFALGSIIRLTPFGPYITYSFSS